VVVVGIRPLLWCLYMYIVTELVPAARVQMSKIAVVHLDGSFSLLRFVLSAAPQVDLASHFLSLMALARSISGQSVRRRLELLHSAPSFSSYPFYNLDVATHY